MAGGEWYCLMTHPRCERGAEDELRDAGCEVYLPMLTRQAVRRGRRLEVTEPLFPGYVFATVGAGQSFYDLRDLDSVRRFVSMDGLPLRMRADRIEQMRHAQALCLLAEPVKPLFAIGEPVMLVSLPGSPIARIIAARPGDRWVIAARWFAATHLIDVSACNLVSA